MDKYILELYTDYLMTSTSKVTGTGLSNILDNKISHDKITRFLSKEDFTSKDLWNKVKPSLRKLECSEEGVLIFDDTIEEKAYSDENDLICWHYDHSIKRNVKGVNQLTLLYYVKGVSIPVGLDFVKKTKKELDKKTKKEKRVSEITKNEQYRNMLKIAVKDNKIEVKYVLNDSWYTSVDTMNFIHNDLKKMFVMPVKSNRNVSLSIKDKKAGNYVSVDSLELKEEITVYLEGMDFPLILSKNILKDQNKKEVSIYLVTDDLSLDSNKMLEIYQKRWNIEVFFKSMKSNCSYSESPTHTVRTQSNHFFCSVYSVFKYEMIKINTNLNHFCLKGKIYLNAMKLAMKEICNLNQLDNFKFA